MKRNDEMGSSGQEEDDIVVEYREVEMTVDVGIAKIETSEKAGAGRRECSN